MIVPVWYAEQPHLNGCLGETPMFQRFGIIQLKQPLTNGMVQVPGTLW